MRLPSVELVVSSALRTAGRFPLVLGTALIAAIAAVLASIAGSSPEFTHLLRTAMLGLPLFFALAVLAERHPHSAVVRWVLPAFGVTVILTFWWVWHDWPSSTQTFRYIQLSAAFHLMAAFAPYLGSAKPNGFWQYNKILFLRFLTAELYSVVLYAGLAIALAAVNKLFGVPVVPETYWRLWIVITFAFHPWFFLSGIPSDLDALDKRTDYPSGLRMFTQYVLVPLVALYLVILTLYLAKVLATRQWPNGWIGYLVSSVAIVGILSWLLIYPLEDRAEYAWVKTFTKGFYVALMPSIVMLWLAIYKRVTEYGITERRYFLIVLSLWLAGVAIYYTVTRSRNIKLIPASLCALALLTFAGPTGAYAVSRTSQVKRLEGILARDGLMQNGHARAGAGAVSFEDRKEISNILHYLLETHGAKSIVALLPDSLGKTLNKSPNTYTAETDARSVMASVGLAYVAAGIANTVSDYFSISASSRRETVPIAGYAYALHMPYWNAQDSVSVAEGVVLRMSADSTGLRLMRGDQVLIDVPMTPLLDTAQVYVQSHGNPTVPSELLRIEAQNGDVAVLAVFTSLAAWRRSGALKLGSFSGDMYIKLK